MNKTKQKIRAAFRIAVLRRDHEACAICGRKDNLDPHHIRDRRDMPCGGYVKENGITLCPEHHLMAELFHQTEGKRWHKGFHPDDLYVLINSSFQLAFQASKRMNLTV